MERLLGALLKRRQKKEAAKTWIASLPKALFSKTQTISIRPVLQHPQHSYCSASRFQDASDPWNHKDPLSRQSSEISINALSKRPVIKIIR